MELTQDELIERMSKAMAEMSGKELADLYNREFGENMKYVGDDMFEQPTTEE
jgi:hypothetical protein